MNMYSQMQTRLARWAAAALATTLAFGIVPVTAAAANAPAGPATAIGTSLADVAAQIGADEMWAGGYTGAGVDVALIDTGVAPVAELSTTSIAMGPDLSFEGGVEAVAGLDTFGHGTHMAGIIAGRTPGADPQNPKDSDFIGIAPGARIVSVKVADNTGAVDVSQVIAAIDWVVQNRRAGGLNIRVLNLSYSTPSGQSAAVDPLSKAVENAWKNGIVVVVSAGNDGRPAHRLGSPATNPYVITVAGADRKKDKWTIPKWSTSGDGVRNPDVAAPGVSILSLRDPGSRIDIEHPEGRVAGDPRLFLGSGSSQSAAVVSGAVALLLQQRPELTPDQVKRLLRSTATDADKPNRVQGSGVIDLVAAMRRPTPTSTQTWPAATGLGSLEAARGGENVSINGVPLFGEFTVTGAPWNPAVWVPLSEAANAWTGSSWSGSSWSGSSWSGSSWSGSSWSGSSWSGSSWSGSSWFRIELVGQQLVWIELVWQQLVWQ
jgi:serine protease AprX